MAFPQYQLLFNRIKRYIYAKGKNCSAYKKKGRNLCCCKKKYLDFFGSLLWTFLTWHHSEDFVVVRHNRVTICWQPMKGIWYYICCCQHKKQWQIMSKLKWAILVSCWSWKFKKMGVLLCHTNISLLFHGQLTPIFKGLFLLFLYIYGISIYMCDTCIHLRKVHESLDL